MPNYKEPAKMPSEKAQEYIMNPGKWISDLKDEIKELKEEIKRKDGALKKIGNIIANQQADAGSYFLHGDMRHVDVQYIHRLAKEARSTEGINDE